MNIILCVYLRCSICNRDRCIGKHSHNTKLNMHHFLSSSGSKQLDLNKKRHDIYVYYIPIMILCDLFFDLFPRSSIGVDLFHSSVLHAIISKILLLLLKLSLLFQERKQIEATFLEKQDFQLF